MGKQLFLIETRKKHKLYANGLKQVINDGPGFVINNVKEIPIYNKEGVIEVTALLQELRKEEVEISTSKNDPLTVEVNYKKVLRIDNNGTVFVHEKERFKDIELKEALIKMIEIMAAGNITKIVEENIKSTEGPKKCSCGCWQNKFRRLKFDCGLRK